MIEMNKNLMKVSTKYGLVTTSAPSTVTGLSGTVPFTIKNFSIYPAVYTVSLTPLSPFVTSVDPAKNISSSTIFQTQNDLFNFTINPATPVGANISFEVSTGNTYWVRKDTITIQYTCLSPTLATTSGIGLNSANVSWAGVSGVTDYYLTFKTSSSAIWNSDVLVTGTSGLLSGLVPNTVYDWKVRTSICSGYSATQNFTTLQECGTPSPSASSVSINGFVLAWPLVSGASSYDVHIRQQGSGIWTPSTVNANTTTVTGLFPNTIYEYEVRANCLSGASLYSVIQTVTTTALPIYCSTNGSNTSEWIDFVQLETISRNSNNETGGFVNTGLSASLIRGATYLITFSAGFSSTVRKENWKIFIDYNGDGDFAGAGETVLNTSKTGSGNFTGTFTVPLTAALSATGLRVKMSRKSISSSCGSFSNGEAEDYSVLITPPVAEFQENSNEEPVNNLHELRATIIPNPFTELITISIIEKYTGITEITLYDINGRVVFKHFLLKDVPNYQINTESFPSGVYIMKIVNGNARKIIRVMK